MGFIRITAENIDAEHICCAMSNKQSDKKKDWLRERFDEGLVFYRSEKRLKSYDFRRFSWSWWPDSNRRPADYE